MQWVVDAAQRSQVADIQAEIADLLRGGGLETRAVGEAATVLSELMSNVLRHTPGVATVSLQWTPDGPVLTVDDRGPGFVRPDVAHAEPDLLAEHGRGLFIISTLAKELKVTRRRGGGARVQVRLAVVA